MAVSVAEYLGQRTDIGNPSIGPVPSNQIPDCPFMNDKCSKLNKKSNPKPPICSVRSQDGTLWMVCPDRLCATKKNVPLSQHQIDILGKVAKKIFSPNISRSDVLVKREVPMPLSAGTNYHADYIMVKNNPTGSIENQNKIVLEMQGGGETSNTGTITRHIAQWASAPTNALLSQSLQGPAPIETNAWRRQQEQFLVKGSIAMKTGGRMVFCMGEHLYDYVLEKVQNFSFTNLHHHNWSLALIGFTENNSQPPASGPIPLVIDQGRLLFTDYQSFVQALTNQGLPAPEIFEGDFISLNGNSVTI